MLLLWRSPARELQVVCASTVIPNVQTASTFLNDHRPVPGCSQLPLYMQQHGHHRAPLQTSQFLKAVPQKKVVRHCEFSEKFIIWKNIMYQMMQLKMHGF
jgi:hypothetical protein